VHAEEASPGGQSLNAVISLKAPGCRQAQPPMSTPSKLWVFQDLGWHLPHALSFTLPCFVNIKLDNSQSPHLHTTFSSNMNAVP
jgi:hypothetical protein